MATIIISIVSVLFIIYEYKKQGFTTSIKQVINGSIEESNINNKIIVVSHYNENHDWLDLFIGDETPHIVYTRSNDPLAIHSLPINKGREAVAYLRYIVDHSMKLPSAIAFVHAHRTSWHQKDPSDIVTALRTLKWNKYPYMSLTSVMTDSTFDHEAKDNQARINYELWRDVLQSEFGPPPKTGIRTHCCATFAVKREAILVRSKVFYSKIIDYILDSNYSDYFTGRTLEYAWHMIFGQPAHINYKTCDIFVCDSNGHISLALAEKK